VNLIVAYGVVGVLAAIPITPGGLGVVETALPSLLVTFGAPAGAAGAAVLAWRLVQFWMPIPLGGLSYASLRLGDLGRRRRLTAVRELAHEAGEHATNASGTSARARSPSLTAAARGPTRSRRACAAQPPAPEPARWRRAAAGTGRAPGRGRRGWGAPGLVDEVVGEHRVGRGRIPWALPGRRVDLDAHEGVAQLLAQPLEALAGTSLSPVKRNPSTHRSGSAAQRAFTVARSSGTRFRSRLWPAAQRERQRRLRQHRGGHHRVDHHRQGEAAGEAHAHHPHAGAAAALVLVAGERPGPDGGRRGRCGGPGGELLRDARPPDGLGDVAGGRLLARACRTSTAARR
jgi:hypothetical protein